MSRLFSEKNKSKIVFYCSCDWRSKGEMKLNILHSWAFFFISAAHLYEPPITTAADNNFDYFFFFFVCHRKQVLLFHVNRFGNSHEMSTLVFSENRENKDCRLPQILLGTLWVKCVHKLG